MSFPAGVDVVTLNSGVSGYRALDGTPYQGTLRLTPSVPRVVSAEHGVIALGVINVTLGASGEFTETVLANDAEGFSPSGWTYRVDEQFTNAPGRAYSILLPAAVPVVALPSLVEVDASDGTVVLTPVSGPAGGDLSGSYPDPTVARVNGVAVSGTPAVGQVPTATSTSTATWQTPSGGGGGSGTPADTVAAETSYGQSSVAGSAGTYSRGDHTHGTPAAPTVGTTAGTYAAGNDSRLSNARTPLAHKASHATGGSDALAPSDIGAETTGTAGAAVSTHAGATDPHADRAYTDTQVAGRVPTSRQVTAGTGLTGGGTLSADRSLAVAYGTTAGTAAVGNDSRLADSRAPSGAASGDLSGTYPGPTVAKLNGVTVSGTPSSGKVLTASSASAADWQTPAAGGGSAIRTARVTVTDDNLGGLPSAASWTIVQTSAATKLQCSIAAAAGDRVRVVGRFMRAGSHFLDWVLLDNAGAIAIYAGTETSSPLSEGDPAEYPSLSFSYDPGPPMFTVGAGHIAAGLVTVALAHQGTGSGVVYAHTTYPWKLRLENIGPEPA